MQNRRLKYSNKERNILLKKNVRSIILIILEYSPIVAPELLKEQKVVITSVKQEYESKERIKDHRTGLKIIYGERKLSMNIGKAKKL